MSISQVQVNFIKGPSALSTWSPLNVNRMFLCHIPPLYNVYLKFGGLTTSSPGRFFSLALEVGREKPGKSALGTRLAA